MSLILNGTTGISDVDGTAAAPALTGTDSNTGIFFPAADTIAFAEGGAEAVRINSSGFVGIGTTTPQRKLSIVGTDGATGQTEGNSRASLFLDNNGANYFSIFTSTSGDGAVFFSDNGSNNGGMVYETSSDALYFRANNAERMRIDSSGNLFLGTTSQINGGVFCVKQTGSNDCINTAPTTAGTYTSARFCNSAGSTIGFISTSTTAVTYSTTSDYRLKEAIAPMTGALAKVSALKPVTYTWKSTGEVDEGFIAHELAEVCPSAVSGEKDAVETYTDEDGVEQTRIKPQGIDTSFLVATLTAAIQEQQALITALTARITALEAI